MNHGTTERDLPYVEDRRDPLLGNDRRCKTCGRIVMGPRMTENGRDRNDLRDNPTVQQTSRGGSGARASLGKSPLRPGAHTFSKGLKT